MSRTRNTITMARGTIAENARRQLSLINRCQMPRNVKRDWRFMGHRIEGNRIRARISKERKDSQTNHIFQQSELRRAG